MLSITLWKVNPDGSPKLPRGTFSLVLYCPIWSIDPSRSPKKQKFISVGLSKYMEI
jgi:hypothetical protein